MRCTAIALSLALTGCASWQQAISGAAAAGAVSARAAEDENIRVWVFSACATPYSAALRNPQIMPGLRALCGPSLLLDDLIGPTVSITAPAPAAGTGAKP
jgi:hypothetical protein